MRILRAGTRGSALALCQTKKVAEALEAVNSGIRVKPVVIPTSGDRILDRSLAAAGGKGLFVRELEEAMRAGIIDFAVHSGKDLPAKLPDPFCAAAVLDREDPSDLLISRPGREFAVVGTSSPRRALMMKTLYPGCEIKLLRGNVPTRIQKLRDGNYDAIVLAAAGVKRLNLDLAGLSIRKFSPGEMVPAACQGILVCEALRNSEAAEFFPKIEQEAVCCQFDIERKLMHLLGADCHDAVGVYAKPESRRIHLWAFWQTPVIRETWLSDGDSDEELKQFAEELRQ